MKRFKNILCVIEPGDTSRHALERAVQLAENNQANLTVVGVIERITAGIRLPDGGPISTDLQAAMIHAHQQRLAPFVDPYRERIDLELKILKGTPFLEIIREVLRHSYDLVIKLPVDRDWTDRFIGSDDMHLLRKCPCPVWLIRPEAPKSYRRILAAVNVDDNHDQEELLKRQALNRQILEIASSLALADFAELHVVHVWDAIGESAMRGAFLHTPEKKIEAYVELVRNQREQALDELLQHLGAQQPGSGLDYLKPKVHLIKGRARTEIPNLSSRIDADLIVMGTVARTGVPGIIMGNTAETILNHIDCSVLAIKPSGFVTPVTLDD
jgi:nucleotide-binding universal stress UspA family protein